MTLLAVPTLILMVAVLFHTICLYSAFTSNNIRPNLVKTAKLSHFFALIVWFILGATQ